jgi:hypothetical protein
MLARSHVVRGHWMLVVVALACSTRSAEEPERFEPRAEPPAVVPEPEAPVVAEPEVSDLSGHRYASKVEFSGSFFINTEIRIDYAVSGTVVIVLGDEGQASVCASARETSGSLAKDRDGNVESRDSDHEWIRGLAGTWSPQGEGARLRLERVDHQRCAVTPEDSPLREPIELACTKVPADATIPRNSLRCELPRRDPLASLGLHGDPPRPWALLAKHPPGSAPVPAEENPWLLIGEAPGLQLGLVDNDDQAGTPLHVEVAEVSDPVL